MPQNLIILLLPYLDEKLQKDFEETPATLSHHTKTTNQIPPTAMKFVGLGIPPSTTVGSNEYGFGQFGGNTKKNIFKTLKNFKNTKNKYK